MRFGCYVVQCSKTKKPRFVKNDLSGKTITLAEGDSLIGWLALLSFGNITAAQEAAALAARTGRTAKSNFAIKIVDVQLRDVVLYQKATTPVKAEFTANEQYIFDELKKIVAENLGVAVRDLKRETTFVADLGCDSLDSVELMLHVEDHWNIQIPDEEGEKVVTMEDAVYLICMKTTGKASGRIGYPHVG